jgi:F-type H+-transporting ATPase subunit b
VELNWSTFVLEIINFLVLVWILARFLYRPVMEVIEKRQAGIEQRLAEADERNERAGQLLAQCEQRVALWQQERQQARESLSQEIAAERDQRMAELHDKLQQERERLAAAEARRRADAERKMEESAVRQGARFASRLLEAASGPDTQARLVDLLLTELRRWSPERIAELQKEFGNSGTAMLVTSAFPLPDEDRRKLQQALAELAGAGTPVRFEQDSGLVAGLRVCIGARVLAANVRDELRGFADLAHEK